MFPMQAEYSSKSSNQNEIKLRSTVVLVMKNKPNGKIEKGLANFRKYYWATEQKAKKSKGVLGVFQMCSGLVRAQLALTK